MQSGFIPEASSNSLNMRKAEEKIIKKEKKYERKKEKISLIQILKH